MFKDPKRVAIVDDDRGIRALVVRALRPEGYSVDPYSSVDEARVGLVEHPVGFVIADLIMPGGTGIELAQHIRREFPERPPPIALVSGSIDDLTDEELSYFDRCLAKPFSVSALRRVAQDLSRRARVLRSQSSVIYGDDTDEGSNSELAI